MIFPLKLACPALRLCFSIFTCLTCRSVLTSQCSCIILTHWRQKEAHKSRLFFFGMKDYSRNTFEICPVGHIKTHHALLSLSCILRVLDFLASIVHIFVLPVPLRQGCQNGDVSLIWFVYSCTQEVLLKYSNSTFPEKIEGIYNRWMRHVQPRE